MKTIIKWLGYPPKIVKLYNKTLQLYIEIMYGIKQ